MAHGGGGREKYIQLHHVKRKGEMSVGGICPRGECSGGNVWIPTKQHGQSRFNSIVHCVSERR